MLDLIDEIVLNRKEASSLSQQVTELSEDLDILVNVLQFKQESTRQVVDMEVDRITIQLAILDYKIDVNQQEYEMLMKEV